jgi:Ankyrin repeats (3 copies)
MFEQEYDFNRIKNYTKKKYLNSDSVIFFQCKNNLLADIKFFVEKHKIKYAKLRSIMRYACILRKYNIVEYLAQKYTPYSYALSYLCRRRHLYIIKSLITNSNFDDINGIALNKACENGDLDVVKNLIQYKTNSIACYACKGGHMNVIIYLFEVCKLNADYARAFDNTPLLNAVIHGHYDAAEYLTKNIGIHDVSAKILNSAKGEIRKLLEEVMA